MGSRVTAVTSRLASARGVWFWLGGFFVCVVVLVCWGFFYYYQVFFLQKHSLAVF